MQLNLDLREVCSASSIAIYHKAISCFGTRQSWTSCMDMESGVPWPDLPCRSCLYPETVHCATPLLGSRSSWYLGAGGPSVRQTGYCARVGGSRLTRSSDRTSILSSIPPWLIYICAFRSEQGKDRKNEKCAKSAGKRGRGPHQWTQQAETRQHNAL